ncbi:MAG: hypothetical protein DHS20C18_21840 [Saprospiraceae bacterium]|nr:MAG: hypothetical protein DHS20C18_21840 [Saprospiraceae bacterium]
MLLIGFPAISWYYLRTGLDYRMEALSELDDLGKIPGFELTNYNQLRVSNANLRGKVVVANFLSVNQSESSNLKGGYLNKLHDQFDERKDVVFVNYLIEEEVDSSGKAAEFAQKFELTDPDQCYFLSGEPTLISQLAKEGFHLPLTDDMALTDNPFMILADTSQTIRKIYDVRDAKQVARLVEHIALILPLQAKRKTTVVEE